SCCWLPCARRDLPSFPTRRSSDLVIIKSDGEGAYLSGDLAYYLDKRERGFDRCLIMLGADHHGYVGRMMAMCAAFGDEPGVNLRSEEHTSELQSRENLVCRLLLEK